MGWRQVPPKDKTRLCDFQQVPCSLLLERVSSECFAEKCEAQGRGVRQAAIVPASCVPPF